MKRITSLFFLLMFVGIGTSYAQCCAAAKAVKEPCSAALNEACAEADEVKVYYFHATRRCATCNAVENVTKEALKETYGDKVKFVSVNRDENINKELVGKYKVSGQTLLIVKGNKEVNLTNDAFMYARTSPDKLKEKLKEAIGNI
jgi:hypothetical protein